MSAQPAALRAAARAVAIAAQRRGDALDRDDAFPGEDVAALHEAGLLTATLPVERGGARVGDAREAALLAFDLLRRIGWGGLPLGRLYEGHVNALKLVEVYGSPEQRADVAREAASGALFGVWNTETEEGLRLWPVEGGWRFEGGKTFASGVGHVDRPLVTARTPEGARLMVMAPGAQAKADRSGWRAQGMRASASGAADFSGVVVTPAAIIGHDDDYRRQPLFSGGAWRFCAVQCGGIERVLDVLRDHLRATGRGGDPYQATRLGSCALAAESARLFTREAALRAEAPGEVAAIVAYVNMARTAVERAGLEALALAQRSIGLAGFMRAHPLERLSRDLATYLRQPNPDKALADLGAEVLQRPCAAPELWDEP